MSNPQVPTPLPNVAVPSSGGPPLVPGQPALSDTSSGGASVNDSDHRESYSDAGTIAPVPKPLDLFRDALRDIDRKVFAERFDFLAELGTGGMGRVLKARDRTMQREVAIKRLKNPDGWDEDLLARFIREARLAGRLNHPNIMTVYDILIDDEGPYLVLEFIDGESLALQLERGPIPWTTAIDLLLPICDAVTAAHAQGIIHRDIKPANILLAKSGTPILGDFGIARSLEGQRVTLTGAVLGTLDYMAPEQMASAKTADARADVYSLAATLYHMVTGEIPRPISSDELPVELRSVILKALHRRPENRPGCVLEFAQLLTEIRRTGAAAAPIISFPPVVTVAPLLQSLADQIAQSTANASQWHLQAQQALKRFDYAAAAELLERIPLKLRHQQQWQDAVAKRDRLSELEATISQLVNDHEYRKLSLPLRQALELVPGREDLLALQQHSPAVALRLGTKAGERTLIDLFGLEIPFRWCPAGKFNMGSPAGEKDRSNDENQIAVELTRGFWLGEAAVTQALFQAVLKAAPSCFPGANRPVENVSWDEAKTFCETLTNQLRDEGILDADGTVSLPTEAQWEYACRAGATTAYSFGNDAARLGQFAWFSENANGETHAVGTREANSWGLRDMSGNVWEWCADWYDFKLVCGTNPVGPSQGSFRVFRGGCWFDSAGGCRSACRGRNVPSFRNDNLGFRVCLSSG